MKKFMIMLMAVCTMFICGMTVNADEVSAPAKTVVTEDSAGIHGNILDIVSDQKYSAEGESKEVKYDGKWDNAPEECKSGDCPACDKEGDSCGGKCKKDCTCGCKDGKPCTCCPCKCGKKCDCCKDGGKCCGCPCCKKDCDCCKEGCKCGDCPKCTPKCDCCKEGCKCGDCPKCTPKCNCCGGKCNKDCTCGCKDGKPCTCGEDKADSVHGNIIDAIKGDKCDCGGKCDKDCTCGCKEGKPCTCDCDKQKCKSKKCKKGCKIKK